MADVVIRASLLVLAAVLAGAGCTGDTTTGKGGDERRAPREQRSDSASSGGWVVASVTDGDTIRLRGGARVRLVQVDAPETNAGPECGGEDAARALRRQLPAGTEVRLERDPGLDATDRYGRLLRYVFVDGRNLNLWLVEQGHAAPYFFGGERGRHADDLQRAAVRARAAGRGLWGNCPRAVLDPERGLSTGPG